MTAVAAALAGVTVASGALAAHAKRGIASSRYLRSDPAALSRLGASWAYNWSAAEPPAEKDLEWVPMIWGSGSLTRSVIASLRNARRDGAARYLLGFNEPDSPSQSNLTPERAAALWPELEQTGLTLGSPAPQVATDRWLTRFMGLARARRLRVDFIALHYYQDFTNPQAVPELRRELTAIHRAFGKPIWITEIGAIDIRAWHEPMTRAPTDALAVSYMRSLFSMLDGLPFVQRYAWFSDDCWNHVDCRYGSLVTASGRITSAGRAFASAP